jgi:hypothetical protein
MKEVVLWPLQHQFSFFFIEFDGDNVGNQFWCQCCLME